jgi:hypothetical protein
MGRISALPRHWTSVTAPVDAFFGYAQTLWAGTWRYDNADNTHHLAHDPRADDSFSRGIVLKTDVAEFQV